MGECWTAAAVCHLKVVGDRDTCLPILATCAALNRRSQLWNQM